MRCCQLESDAVSQSTQMHAAPPIHILQLSPHNLFDLPCIRVNPLNFHLEPSPPLDRHGARHRRRAPRASQVHFVAGTHCIGLSDEATAGFNPRAGLAAADDPRPRSVRRAHDTSALRLLAHEETDLHAKARAELEAPRAAELAGRRALRTRICRADALARHESLRPTPTARPCAINTPARALALPRTDNGTACTPARRCR